MTPKPSTDTRERRALRPDAQAFDEIRLVTVPRYKTSHLSGDEWRISVRVEFYRKGEKVHETGYTSMEYAVQLLPHAYISAIEDGKAFFAGESDKCDQEGCHETATVTYRMKKEFCRSGHESDPYEYQKEPLIRKFCELHSTRGDCGLDDADRNYELLSGEANEPSGVDVSPSTFGGIIKMENDNGD